MVEHDFELGRFQASNVAAYRKFLVVVDDSPECRVAIRFAAGRAAHTIGGRVLLFYVLRPEEFHHWLGVADVMADEAREEAEGLLREIAGQIYDHVGLQSEIVIVQGEPVAKLTELIHEDADIFALILGARPQGDPGPLVRHFSGEHAGNLPCPVVIVPGAMPLDRIDTIV